MSNIARILIAGAGALGSVFGGFLRRAGHHVTLLGRGPHLEAIAEGGLHIEGIWGEHRVAGFTTATSAGALRGPFDLTIVAVKSSDGPALAAAIAGAVGSWGSVLTVQNGLGNLEAMAAVFGRSRVLGAPVLVGAEIPSPGRARVTVYAKPVRIGAPWGEAHGAARWAATLADAGIPAEPTDRLFAYLWEKVLYNAALNPLGALLRVPYGALGERAETRAIMDAVLAEGFAVARAEGVDLLWSSLEECRRHFYDTLLPPTAHHRSSMLQDLERGRRTEIDAINGYIVERGRARGVATPVNAVVTGMVRFAQERSRLIETAAPGKVAS